jgi:hypothetical protein
MRIGYLTSSALLSAALMLSACGGGGGGSGETSSAIKGGETTAPPTLPPGETGITASEAARLAKQASFGPTPALIDHIVALKSASAWIDEQLGLRSSTYADLAAAPVPTNFCAAATGQTLTNCNRDNYSVVPMTMRFYSNAIARDDQLRQRVAFALSQILVASDLEVHTTAGLATYNQILLDKGLGNYRDILAAVTLNPFMGNFLDMVDSNKTTPNENYARELMQLFSLGTVLLNADGTPQTDSAGAPVAAYTNTDVKEVARALTGWTYARLDGAPVSDYSKIDYSKPMILYPARYDTGSKTFLGKTVAANATQQASVDAVVDAVFNHPNTGPFICKRLIQQLGDRQPHAGLCRPRGGGVRQQRRGCARRHEGGDQGNPDRQRGARLSRDPGQGQGAGAAGHLLGPGHWLHDRRLFALHARLGDGAAPLQLSVGLQPLSLRLPVAPG